jgi:phage shock protein A
MAQARRLQDEERDLHASTAAHLRAGNREAAGRGALRLRGVTHDLDEYRRQIRQAEDTYQELLAARDVTVKAAQARLDALRLQIDDLKLQRASAELHEMAAGLVASVGGSGDTLARLQEMIEREREQATGRARVARDSLWRREAELREDEAQALGEQALAEFAAREGLALDAPAPAPALPAKTPSGAE